MQHIPPEWRKITGTVAILCRAVLEPGCRATAFDETTNWQTHREVRTQSKGSQRSNPASRRRGKLFIVSGNVLQRTICLRPPGYRMASFRKALAMNLSASGRWSTIACLQHFRCNSPHAASSLLSRIARWLVAAVTYLTASTVIADDLPIIKVEEDWRVEVGTPALEDHAPQIVTVLSPVGNLEKEHAVFELNHTTYPEYFPGGMQLQGWRGEWLSSYGSTPHQQRLNLADEVITFTSSMKIEDGTLEFQIKTASRRHGPRLAAAAISKSATTRRWTISVPTSQQFPLPTPASRLRLTESKNSCSPKFGITPRKALSPQTIHLESCMNTRPSSSRRPSGPPSQNRSAVQPSSGSLINEDFNQLAQANAVSRTAAKQFPAARKGSTQ